MMIESSIIDLIGDVIINNGIKGKMHERLFALAINPP